MNVNLVKYIIVNIFPKVFNSEGQSQNISKFGMFLIDDMIDFLGLEIVGEEIWLNFHPVFMQFCLNSHCVVRQASSYGLGIYAEKTPPERFKPLIEKSLQVLVTALQIPKTAE